MGVLHKTHGYYILCYLENNEQEQSLYIFSIKTFFSIFFVCFFQKGSHHTVQTALNLLCSTGWSLSHKWPFHLSLPTAETTGMHYHAQLFSSNIFKFSWLNPEMRNSQVRRAACIHIYTPTDMKYTHTYRQHTFTHMATTSINPLVLKT